MFQRSRVKLARRGLLLLALALAVGLAAGLRPVAPAYAQARLVSLVSQDNGHAALGLALRRLAVVGTLMQTAAHPDDEHSQLYALLTLGEGLRSVDVQTTRGEGGQNEIGPELFRDLGVLRTSELLSAHRLDGAEQWFTRAIDYGYSFDPEEVYRFWGRDEVVGDFVRLIRMHRPDVVLTMAIQGRGGDRAHEATAVLTREAFRAAADPARYPDQIKSGLRPWQAKKLYFTVGYGGFGGPPSATASPESAGHLATIDTGAYDPLLGRTYQEIGADARSSHKCQGMGQLVPLPGGIGGGRGPAGPSRYRLVDSTIAGEMDKDETSLFDGVDTSLAGLAKFAGANPPEGLKAGLAAIAEQARLAQKAFDSGDDAATTGPVVAGLNALRSLRAQLGSMGLSGTARFEIDCRLTIKEADYDRAALLSAGLAFEALADDGLVVAGQPVRLSFAVANRGAADVAVSGVSVAGFAKAAGCAAGTAKARGVFTCTADVQVPADARLTEPYWTDQYLGYAAAEGRAQHLRARRRVRPAVPAVPVPRRLPRANRRDGRAAGAGDPVSLREGHLRRREADGAERRARLLGEDHAVDGRDSRGADGGREADRAGDLRLGDERRERRGVGERRARAAEGLDGRAGRRAARLLERGRIADRPLHGEGAGVGHDRDVSGPRGGHLADDRRDDVRSRLPGDRLPACRAAAGHQAGRDRPGCHRRPNRSQPEGRLHRRRRRPGPARARAARGPRQLHPAR